MMPVPFGVTSDKHQSQQCEGDDYDSSDDDDSSDLVIVDDFGQPVDSYGQLLHGDDEHFFMEEGAHFHLAGSVKFYLSSLFLWQLARRR